MPALSRKKRHYPKNTTKRGRADWFYMILLRKKRNIISVFSFLVKYVNFLDF